jgi:polyferredoxin
MKRIVRFLKYTFLGEINGRTARIVRVEAFGRKKAQEKEQDSPPPEKNQIILIINWALIFAFVVFTLIMFIYAVFYKGEKLPEYVNNVFFMILGWFGSAYTSFLRIDQK